MYELKGKVAIVTGSGRGIGRAIAVRLGKEGMKIIVNAKKRKEELEETVKLVKENGGEAIGVQADVATREGCKQLVEVALKNFGRLDVLVNNAGLGLFSFFLNADDNLINKQLDVSLKSAIYCSQEAAKVMTDGGVIINISSIAGLEASPGLAFYGIAKAGLISLTKTLAVELAPRIRVNAVAPGVVRTKMGESLINILNLKEEEFAKRSTLLGRIVEPEDVAEVVVMLVKVPTITGEVVVIDSGQTLMRGLANL
ncbi:MAG: glucose 1-dehydrogenase [Candidatus Methanomethylicia archaeon]|uniref:glucose 1-dehydrogenase n=1 Tax=Saccharolobus sp. TaxID=2100761 RepID=UPI0031654E4E